MFCSKDFVFHLPYILLYFVGGLSVCKAGKGYKIAKTTLMDHQNKLWETTKVGKPTGLNDVGQASEIR